MSRPPKSVYPKRRKEALLALILMRPFVDEGPRKRCVCGRWHLMRIVLFGWKFTRCDTKHDL